MMGRFSNAVSAITGNGPKIAFLEFRIKGMQ